MESNQFFYPLTERFRKIVYGYDVYHSRYLPLEIDPINWGLHTIESEHHEIHEQTSFTAYYGRTTDATNGHRSGIYIKTPAKEANTKYCHMIASFACSTAADASILEAPTITANVGTHTEIIRNRFRDSVKISGCFNNATAPAQNYITTLTEAQIAADGAFAAGTTLRSEPLSTGVGPRPAGGTTRGTEEYILKYNTAYIFLLTNTAASANRHWILLDWYEHRTHAH